MYTQAKASSARTRAPTLGVEGNETERGHLAPVETLRVSTMGEQHRSPPKTSLLFKALRSGGSLQFFCPELDYGNEVCVCARGLWEWDGLTQRRVVTRLTSCLAHGRRTGVSCWQAQGFDEWAKNVLGLNGAMCCSQASCKFYFCSESAWFIGAHVKASVIGVCVRVEVLFGVIYPPREVCVCVCDLSTTCSSSASQFNNVFDV